MGALVMLVAVQLSVLGLYLPPVFNPLPAPPQTIISLPVQTATWLTRAVGALAMLVAVHASLVQPGFGVGVGIGVGVGDGTGVDVGVDVGFAVDVGVPEGVGVKGDAGIKAFLTDSLKLSELLK